MIDANIALGVKPVQIENPLNALSKVLSIRQQQGEFDQQQRQYAQQERELENQNKLRDYFSQNDPKSPEFVRGLYGVNPAQAMAFEKNQLEAKKGQTEIDAKAFDLATKREQGYKSTLAALHDRPDLSKPLAIAAMQSKLNEGLITPQMFEHVISDLPDDPNALREQLRQGLKEQLSPEQKLTLFAPKFEYKDSGQQLIPVQTNPLAAGYTAPKAIQRVQTPDSVASNATTRRGQDLVDGRAKEANQQSGKPPAGYRYLPNGDLEAITGGPADLKAQATAGLKAAGVADVDSAIAVLRDAYGRLEKGGGITSTEKGALSNIGSSLSSSGAGQAVGRALGTNNQSARNDIAMTRPALLAALMKATGMSAKQMDSNAELKLWMATATDPTLDVESNRRALDNIERKYIGAGTSQPINTPANPQDAQAMEWAKANPNDPRSKAIMQRLGGK